MLFLRYYSKFEPPYDVIGSSHNGFEHFGPLRSGLSVHPGRAGGRDQQVSGQSGNWRGDAATASPGESQHLCLPSPAAQPVGDHFFPTGLVMPNTSIPSISVPDFVSRPDIIPALDQWYGYELMVKANTPGQNDVASPRGSTASWSWISPTCACATWPA